MGSRWEDYAFILGAFLMISIFIVFFVDTVREFARLNRRHRRLHALEIPISSPIKQIDKSKGKLIAFSLKPNSRK